MVSLHQRCVLQQQGRRHPLGTVGCHSLLPPMTKHKLEGAVSVLTSHCLAQVQELQLTDTKAALGRAAHSPGTALWLDTNLCSGTFASIDFPAWARCCHFFQHRCTQAAPCIRWAICQENQPRTNGKPNGNSAGKQYFLFCSRSASKRPPPLVLPFFCVWGFSNSPMFAAGASQKGCFALTLGNRCSEVLKAT